MIIHLATDTELSAEAKKNILEQLYYLAPDVETCLFVKEGIIIEMHSGAIPPSDMAEKAEKIVARTLRSFKKVRTKIFFENQGRGKNQTNPLADLSSSRQIVENFPGTFIYQGEFLKHVRRLDEIIKQLADQFHAIEQDYPTTVPLFSMLTNGYLSSFAQHAIFASPAQPNLPSLEIIQSRAKEPCGLLPNLRDILAMPQQMLAPTVCYHCFEALRKQRIPDEGMAITALAKCHRHERGTLSGLERLQTFTMRELIFYGSEESVEERLAACIGHAKKNLENWGLESRIISATDPFFGGESAQKRSYQSFLDLKKELQLRLPYNDKWLAVASFNNHRDTLVKAYDISWNPPTSLFSGCVGYGFERFVFAVLSQFGADFKGF